MLNKEQKTKLRAVYGRDVWQKSPKMADYCTNKAAQLVELPGGDMIQIDKISIEKRFCFGESGYDFEDAAAAANVARTSENYFLRENMKEFDGWINDISEQWEMHNAPYNLPRCILLIAEKPYIGQPESSPLKGLQFLRGWEVLEALGGSAFVKDLPGTRIECRSIKYRVPTAEELKAIEAGFKTAAAEHEKKVKTYLKKYGLQHVHAWTYWRDA